MARTVCLTVFVLFLALFPFSLPAASDSVVIYAIYYDTYLSNEPDEAVALMNISSSPIALAGWQVTDSTTGSDEGTVTFPSFTIQPGQIIWITKTATSFKTAFGYDADFEYGSTDSDPAVPNMTGTALSLTNTGDECLLKNSSGTVIDTIVYEGGDVATSGWSGAAVYPYSEFTAEGQILSRKLDEATCLPTVDTDTIADWAQSTDDDHLGKKLRRAGWDTEHFFDTKKATENCHLEYWISPDNVLGNYLEYINNAAASIYIEGYAFESYPIEQAITARQAAGIQVKILLEANALTDQGRWVAQQIENAGGQVYFMDADATTGEGPRYNYQHAKFCVIDGTWLLTGSENLNNSSFAADDMSNGTDGHRGVYIATNAASIVAHFMDIYNRDLDAVNHVDIRRWSAATDSPPVDFVPFQGLDLITYPVQFWNPLVMDGTFDFEVIQAPDNCLREDDSLIGMIARAGTGGKVYVEQLYEYEFWGPSTSSPATDPNLRLEAYIDAARRGADVKIILDSVYDAGYNNADTMNYVNGIASSEGLNLQCRRDSPTATGIHNKMVLVHDGTHGWTHTGSINGSENSNKANRELAVQVKSDEGFNYLASVFNYDWVNAGGSPITVNPPGELLELMLSSDGTDLAFSWTTPAECNSQSYSIYRGDLSTLASGGYNHDTAIVCSRGDASYSIALDDTRLGLTDYFLVVASNGVEEGSYGRSGTGTERPVSSSACKEYQTIAGCSLPVCDSVSATASVLPAANVILGTEQTFSGSGSGEGTLNYEWDFSYDGVTFNQEAVGTSIAHTYGSTGTYTAAFRVTDSCLNPSPQQAISTLVINITDAPLPAKVVISQVYGGGGNSGSTYKNDFIELFNAGGTTQNLAGWAVQYTSSAGTSWTNKTDLSGSIPAGGYYLIKEAAGGAGTVDLPTPDATGTIMMSATAGKVALTDTTTFLSGSCPTGGAIQDFVGYGTTADCYEGSGPAPAPNNATSDSRNSLGCADSGDNASDFTVGAPNPRNSASPQHSC
ncbi:MAG TPA: lamin tail domain-containing protein [Acidobacteriota bacterium]|nr:lamin tail domain-containing protein [Acidobacteriota bacterium]